MLGRQGWRTWLGIGLGLGSGLGLARAQAHQPTRQLDIRADGERGQAHTVGLLRPTPLEEHATVSSVLGRQGWRTGRGGGSIELQRAWLGLGVGVGVEPRLRVRATACKYYLLLTTYCLPSEGWK